MLPFSNVTGTRGRPKFDITKKQIEYLLDLSFSATDIARIRGVSKRTIFKRLADFGLSVSSRYSSINDVDLDVIVKDIFKDFPNTEYRRMIGFLKTNNLRLQESRDIRCMRRVDPDGILRRPMDLTFINRRKYHVKGTNSLWHIDVNHKLIRWNFVIR